MIFIKMFYKQIKMHNIIQFVFSEKKVGEREDLMEHLNMSLMYKNGTWYVHC